MIRDKSSAPKIKKPSANLSQGCISEQHPWFSFRYMTTNKHYCLSYLDKLQLYEREKTLSGLFSKLEELSQKPWVFWTQKPRTYGLETIEFEQLNFSPGNSAPVTKDSKVYVFRFDTYQGSEKGRIIGFKNSPCAVLHILGYDFDFSAYKH